MYIYIFYQATKLGKMRKYSNKKWNCTLTFIVVLFFSYFPSKSEVSLPKLFADHAVLQRDVPVPVWGWAAPDENITITISGQSHKLKADKNGDWKINLKPQSAGGPYDMIIQGKNTIVLKDILFGEVWLCTGQSNMQWTLKDFGIKIDTIRDNANDIRLFGVWFDMDYLPRRDVKNGWWQKASPETVGGFSATAYFFGQYLYQNLKVPIGLISSNLGATSIETWMSAGALKQFPQFDKTIETNLATGKNFEQLYADLKIYRETWDKDYYLKNDPGIIGNWQDPATNISDWKDIDIPMLWEDAGLQNYDGSVWFRRTFDLPKDFKGEDFNIALNQIDDYDIAWVNGVKIGESFGVPQLAQLFF